MRKLVCRFSKVCVKNSEEKLPMYAATLHNVISKPFTDRLKTDTAPPQPCVHTPFLHPHIHTHTQDVSWLVSHGILRAFLACPTLFPGMPHPPLCPTFAAAAVVHCLCYAFHLLISARLRNVKMKYGQLLLNDSTVIKQFGREYGFILSTIHIYL